VVVTHVNLLGARLTRSLGLEVGHWSDVGSKSRYTQFGGS